MAKYEVKSVAQIAAEVANTPPDYCVASVKDGRVVFDKNPGYSIHLGSEMRNTGELLQWIHHLSQKKWVTSETIRTFIEAVCWYRGWKIY